MYAMIGISYVAKLNEISCKKICVLPWKTVEVNIKKINRDRGEKFP